MRKNQENKFTMIKTLNAYLIENQEIVSGISELGRKQQELIEISDSLKAKDKEKKNSLAGKAATKLAFKEIAIKTSVSISAALFAYAKKTENTELSENTNISAASLEKLRDTMLVEAFEGLRNLASAYITELAPFGITQEKLDAFSQKIVNYDESISKKETGRVKRSGAVKTLLILFHEADEIFEVMDKLVNGIEDEDKQEFVRGFKDARKISNLGVRHKSGEEKAPVIAA